MNGEFQLENFLPYRLNRASEKISLSFAQIYKNRFGMTRPEWRTLANLGDHGRMTAKEICLKSGQHKTKVSRAVSGLENRNWLKRLENPNDRREEWLELTKKGLQSYQALALLGIAQDNRLKEALGRENFEALNKGLFALEALNINNAD